MQVKVEHWLDLGQLGEKKVEIVADVIRGDADGPSIFRGIQADLEEVRLEIGNNSFDITGYVLSYEALRQECIEQVFDVYDEAAAAARTAYRHIDLVA
jgi:hypothetical protein